MIKIYKNELVQLFFHEYWYKQESITVKCLQESQCVFYFKSKMIRRIVLDACMPSERWNFHLSFQEVATDHGLKHRFIEKYLLTKSPWNCTHPQTQASKPFWKNSGLCSSSLSLLMVIYLETPLAQTLWDPKWEIIVG